MCPPNWTSLPPPSPSRSSRLSQSTRFELPVSYSKLPLAICFTYGNVYVSMIHCQFCFNATLSICPTLSLLHFVHKSVLYVSADTSWHKMQYKKKHTKKQNNSQDFPGCPGVKTLHFQCRELGFNPWPGTKIPHALQCGWKIKNKAKRNQKNPIDSGITHHWQTL